MFILEEPLFLTKGLHIYGLHLHSQSGAPSITRCHNLGFCFHEAVGVIADADTEITAEGESKFLTIQDLPQIVCLCLRE